jgi:hypothetical protein
MVLTKCAIGACVLLLAAAAGDSTESKPTPAAADPVAQPANGYAPTVDMRQFQLAFN